MKYYHNLHSKIVLNKLRQTESELLLIINA